VNVNVNVNPNVHVEPVVVEVPLGAKVFGISIRIDPRFLPLDRLRGACFVEVELSGPADQLSSFQAQLSATIGNSGARVDAWSNVATDASIVTARFKIFPPGSHP